MTNMQANVNASHGFEPFKAWLHQFVQLQRVADNLTTNKQKAEVVGAHILASPSLAHYAQYVPLIASCLLSAAPAKQQKPSEEDCNS
jgi:hypothetical protein